MEHHRAGRRTEAEQGYRQVLELEPHNADALYGMGQIMQRRGEHAAAIETFRTLLAAHPDTLKAWFRLGRSLRARGQPAEAASAYCEGIARQPAIAGAYFDLGHLLLELEQPDQAVAAFDVARSLQADFPGIDASLTKALSLGDGWSPEQLARRAALHPDVRDRVGKLSAIAAAAERQRRAQTPVAARERGDVEPA
jgi:tetratricopeptide (TPR) repeat protein